MESSFKFYLGNYGVELTHGVFLSEKGVLKQYQAQVQADSHEYLFKSG